MVIGKDTLKFLSLALFSVSTGIFLLSNVQSLVFIERLNATFFYDPSDLAYFGVAVLWGWLTLVFFGCLYLREIKDKDLTRNEFWDMTVWIIILSFTAMALYSLCSALSHVRAFITNPLDAMVVLRLFAQFVVIFALHLGSFLVAAYVVLEVINCLSFMVVKKPEQFNCLAKAING